MVYLAEFKLPGLKEFELELDPEMTVGEVKELASDESDILPEHMRLLMGDTVLKNSDAVGEVEGAIRVMYTAGHESMVGGGKPQSIRQYEKEPFRPPVRGLAGSKGLRLSRISARPGGNGLIRKYGILLKRQEFREKAEEIGFRKYR